MIDDLETIMDKRGKFRGKIRWIKPVLTPGELPDNAPPFTACVVGTEMYVRGNTMWHSRKSWDKRWWLHNTTEDIVP
jgi:hypothetical protein